MMTNLNRNIYLNKNYKKRKMKLPSTKEGPSCISKI